MSKPKTLRLFLSPKLPDDSGQFSLSLDFKRVGDVTSVYASSEGLYNVDHTSIDNDATVRRYHRDAENPMLGARYALIKALHASRVKRQTRKNVLKSFDSYAAQHPKEFEALRPEPKQKPQDISPLWVTHYPQECKIVMASSRYNELLAAEQELRTLKANADRLREFERACKAVQQAMKL